jgi:hypothetical protein
MKARSIGVWVCVAAIAVLSGLGPPASANSTLGTGVGASPLELVSPAHPGGSYHLVPELLVVNTGTDAAHYELRVDRLSDRPQHTLPASWIRFAVNDFVLGPNDRRSITVHVAVPASAVAGTYKSNVVATGVLPHRIDSSETSA